MWSHVGYCTCWCVNFDVNCVRGVEITEIITLCDSLIKLTRDIFCFDSPLLTEISTTLGLSEWAIRTLWHIQSQTYTHKIKQCSSLCLLLQLFRQHPLILRANQENPEGGFVLWANCSLPCTLHPWKNSQWGHPKLYSFLNVVFLNYIELVLNNTHPIPKSQRPIINTIQNWQRTMQQSDIFTCAELTGSQDKHRAGTRICWHCVSQQLFISFSRDFH